MSPIRPLLALLVLLTTHVAPAYAEPAPILFTRVALDGGQPEGTTLLDRKLVLAAGETSGRWTAARSEPGFGFTRLVASWNAETPGDSHLRVEVQATTAGGIQTDWYTLAIWAADDHAVQRTSVRGQSDAFGRIDTDTLFAQGDPFTAYTLRISLNRATPEDPAPALTMLGAAISNTTYSATQPTSLPSAAEAILLPVPAYSQEIHARQYPQYGGGGEAWCSPTSTQMVVEYWGRGPSESDLAWVNPNYADRSIDHAARATYDAAYRGTGNWPFNTAYAAAFGLDAFVTQLRSLDEAEHFVRGGIPLVASIASNPRELDGFLFDGGTNGHLVVIVGFDGADNPIVNDPAAWTDSSVQRTYDRAQFERVWLRGSGGTVYVIHPPEVALPRPPIDATPNW
jgi:hypothetical protein